MTTKICKTCEKEKSISDFSINQNKSSNKNYHTRSEIRYNDKCKSCCSEWQKVYRKKKLAEDPDFYNKARSKPKLSDEQKMFNSFVSCRVGDAKGRAKKYNKPYDIDKFYMRDLWTGFCAISGLPLNLIKGDKHVGSIDCIEPTKGYTKGNVQWVSWAVNRAKGDLSSEDFLNMCKAITERATTIET